MKAHHTIFTGLAIATAVSTSATAAMISVNIDRTSGGAAAMAPTTVAGVVAVDNWNNISSDAQTGTTTGSALLNDSGAATTTNVTIFNGLWRDGVDASTGDHQMQSDYTNTSTTANGIINVSGLGPVFTGSGYNVIVYLTGTDGMGLDTAAEFGANIDGGTSQWIRAIRRNPSFNGAWNSTTFATDDLAQASNTESNYIMFTGLNSANFDINILKDPDTTSNWGRAAVTGLQIVAVPEPSSSALLGLGGLALLLRRHK